MLGPLDHAYAVVARGVEGGDGSAEGSGVGLGDGSAEGSGRVGADADGDGGSEPDALVQPMRRTSDRIDTANGLRIGRPLWLDDRDGVAHRAIGSDREEARR